MPMEMPPEMSVSSFAGFLKGKSGLTVYERWSIIKFNYRNREFWSKRGLSAEKNVRQIAGYIRNQLKEDFCQIS